MWSKILNLVGKVADTTIIKQVVGHRAEAGNMDRDSMDIHQCIEDGAGKIVLAGSLTVETAGMVQLTLLQMLDRVTTIELQVGGVDDLDTAGIQLLCALSRSARQRGITLEVAGRLSAEVERKLRLSGMLPEHLSASPDSRLSSLLAGCLP